MKEINEYREYADKNGYTLSKYAEKIIRMVNMNDGNCPCKKGCDDQKCPCPDHHKEIESNGSCTCNLFLKEI